MSMVGPGGTGTTMVMGFAVGQDCASPGGIAAKMHNPLSTTES